MLPFFRRSRRRYRFLRRRRRGFNLLDGGDGDDFVGVSGNSNGLRGGAGNDFVGATGNDNTLDGGFGNDQLEAAGAGHTGAMFIFHAGYGAMSSPASPVMAAAGPT